MKKIVIIIVIIAIGILGVTMLIDRTDTIEDMPFTDTTEDDEVVDFSGVLVTYTDGGFNPAVLTVGEGDTVRFLNDSSRSMWVASNPHPTHTIYPEFEQSSSSGPGDFYEFTFDRAGSWGYHNHTFELHGGTVIVEER